MAGETLVKSSVLLGAASTSLLTADPGRRCVIVANPSTNAAAVIDITGGNAATGGLPLAAGDAIELTGMDAKLAMTALGTLNQSLTVFVGR